MRSRRVRRRGDCILWCNNTVCAHVISFLSIYPACSAYPCTIIIYDKLEHCHVRCHNIQARSQVGNRGVSRLANLGRAAAKQPLLPRSAKIFLGSSASKGKSALLASRTREGCGTTELTNRTAYRRDSTVPSVYPNPKLIIRENSNPRNGCSSCCGSDGDGSGGLLLITPKRLAGFCSLLH